MLQFKNGISEQVNIMWVTLMQIAMNNALIKKIDRGV